MNSILSSFNPEAEKGETPKQMDYIPKLKLNDGHEIPMLAYGFGTKNFKRGQTTDLDNKLVDLGVKAIKKGYYHLDGAQCYNNEAELGTAIKKANVPRSQLFVTTKTIPQQGGISASEALQQSLDKLGLDYVDLYLTHVPFFAGGGVDSNDNNNHVHYDTNNEKVAATLQAQWAEMEACLASGLTRSIGVSNYIAPHLQAVLRTAKVVPAINQIEMHPYLQHEELLQLHREHGIATAAYSPLSAIIKACPGPLDDTYASLAAKYGVEETEVALRWILDLGVVAITTSSNEKRLKQLLSVLPTFKLTPREVQTISEIGQQKHYRGWFNEKYTEDDRR